MQVRSSTFRAGVHCEIVGLEWIALIRKVEKTLALRCLNFTIMAPGKFRFKLVMALGYLGYQKCSSKKHVTQTGRKSTEVDAE